MGFFSGVQTASNETEQQALNKALTAGYGTDSATFVNGRAMIPEDLEATTVNVVAQMKDDCKLFNSLKTQTVGSTVHEYNRRTNYGSYRHLSVPEGGASAETNQSLERKFLEMKYLQTRRSVTEQMMSVNSFENALATEKLAGIETIVQAAEFMCFHGDSKVDPTQWDGLLAQLRAADSRSYIKDARGKTVGAMGEDLFDDCAREVWERHGDLKKAYFPSVLAKDIKKIFDDKLRYVVNQGVNQTGLGLPAHTTAIGSTIELSGSAGADKFFHVKGEVRAEGDVSKRPVSPATVTAKAGSAADSKFGASDAGDYKYTVYAVNYAGISEGTSIAAPVTVAAGNGVTLTIANGSGVAPTGFIIARSNKGGDKVMEMTQVAANPSGTTTFVDLNEELPGTAEMVLLSEGRTSPIITFDQLTPVKTIPLYPTATAETPFLIVLYGALQNSAPEFCSLVKNIGYSGGLY